MYTRGGKHCFKFKKEENTIKRKNKFIVKFKAIDSYAMNVADPPVPASSYVPKWWKDMKTFTSNRLLSKEGSSNIYTHVTGKKCFPMLDAMTTGYIIPLWADLEVSYVGEDKEPTVTWLTDRAVVTSWALEFTEGMEKPDDCTNIAFKLSNQFIIETPPCWSSIFIHPVGYPNLPFRSIAGVVDTDKLKTDVNQPFWIKKGFTGVIPQGTPIAQVIPFQRQEWESTVEEMPKDSHYHNHQKYLKTKAQGAYGIYQRVKKSFK